jgi:hypothetical protein
MSLAYLSLPYLAPRCCILIAITSFNLVGLAKVAVAQGFSELIAVALAAKISKDFRFILI